MDAGWKPCACDRNSKSFFLLENLTVIAKMETDEGGKKKAEGDGAAIRQTERIPDSAVLTDILKFF